MEPTNSVLNLFSNDLIKSLSILLVPIAIKYFENKYFSEIAQKKNVWKKFIEKNPSINNCFSNYEKIEQISQVGLKFTYIIMFFSIFYFMIEFMLSVLASILVERWVPYILENTLHLEMNQISSDTVFENVFFSIIFLSTLLPLSSSRKIKEYENKLKDDELLLIKSDELLSTYSKVKKLFYFSIFFSFVHLYFSANIFIEVTDNVILLSAIVFHSGTVYTSISNKQSYTTKVKDIVNKKYSRNFPILEISTVGAERFVGKLEDIFNYESVALDKNNIKTIILWNAVASIKEVGKNNPSEQKLLSDYFK
ncbi:MAG: hypothetical protein AB3K77_02205 [Methanosarcinaceae archaeon]